MQDFRILLDQERTLNKKIKYLPGNKSLNGSMAWPRFEEYGDIQNKNILVFDKMKQFHSLFQCLSNVNYYQFYFQPIATRAQFI